MLKVMMGGDYWYAIEQAVALYKKGNYCLEEKTAEIVSGMPHEIACCVCIEKIEASHVKIKTKDELGSKNTRFHKHCIDYLASLNMN